MDAMSVTKDFPPPPISYNLLIFDVRSERFSS